MRSFVVTGLLTGVAGQDVFLERTTPHVENVERLRKEIHTLNPEEAAARFWSMPRRTQAPPRQDKIEHFVVLYVENHAFDHMMGCMDLPGADGIPASGHKIPKDPDDHSKGYVTVTCGKPDYVCKSGPSYSFLREKFRPGANYHTYPYDEQSDDFSYANGAHTYATTMFSKEQIPVKYALAKEFGVFNKMYTAAPTMSWPNHMFTVSATSCGCTSTGPTYDKGGGNTTTYPQLTVFDVLYLDNVSFGMYGNTSNVHDSYMAGILRHSDHYHTHTTFYKQAAEGTLPAFSYVYPCAGCSDHPCQDIRKGERQLKDIYEAVRAGPGWDKTLFLVAYDDGGSYYDHIVPPFKHVPADGAPCSAPNQGFPTKFDFRRLGLRTSNILMSPWVEKGAVFQEPKHGPTSTSEFELTSVVSTVKRLFNLSVFLTNRDAWAAPFDELLLKSPRTDCPMHLPAAPTASWTSADFQNDDDDDDELYDTVLYGRRLSESSAQHCSSGTDVCPRHEFLNTKQRKDILLLAKLTGIAEPNLEDMTSAAADRWLGEHWDLWRRLGKPVK